MRVLGIVTTACGCSSVAELQLPKLIARVRFSSPAPPIGPAAPMAATDGSDQGQATRGVRSIVRGIRGRCGECLPCARSEASRAITSPRGTRLTAQAPTSCR